MLINDSKMDIYLKLSRLSDYRDSFSNVEIEYESL